MNSRRSPVLLSVAMILLTSCAAASASGERLVVFTAASLTQAFEELAGDFQREYPEVEVALHFAGSQRLRMQLEQGAVADVYVSANTKQMAMAVEGGLIHKSGPVPFISNRLVVIMPEGNPAGVMSLADLEQGNLKLLLAAEEVPVGRYARRSLEKMESALGEGFKDRVLARVVSNENNVKQVVAKVALGEGDAGIVYVSDLKAAPELETIAIPAPINVSARYELATTSSSCQPGMARGFVDFVLSARGQSTLTKWGFTSLAEVSHHDQ